MWIQTLKTIAEVQTQKVEAIIITYNIYTYKTAFQIYATAKKSTKWFSDRHAFFFYCLFRQLQSTIYSRSIYHFSILIFCLEKIQMSFKQLQTAWETQTGWKSILFYKTGSDYHKYWKKGKFQVLEMIYLHRNTFSSVNLGRIGFNTGTEIREQPSKMIFLAFS